MREHLQTGLDKDLGNLAWAVAHQTRSVQGEVGRIQGGRCSSGPVRQVDVLREYRAVLPFHPF